MDEDKHLYEQCVLSICLNYEYATALKTCDEQINVIARLEDIDIIYQAWEKFIDATEELSNITYKFDNILDIIKYYT